MRLHHVQELLLRKSERSIDRRRKRKGKKRPREKTERKRNTERKKLRERKERRKRDRERARERERAWFCLISIKCFHTFCTRSYIRTLILAYTAARLLASQRCCIALKTITTMLYRTQDYYNDVVSHSRLLQRCCIALKAITTLCFCHVQEAVEEEREIK